jgi:Cof subfamily protein (haloacid dehalogenase superfamily)
MSTDKKLIAIDLDGTTLQSDGVSVSAYTKDVFDRVEALGHTIVIATGRPYRMAIDIYKKLGLTSPMINFNGALIIKPNDREWPYYKEFDIPKEFVLDFYELRDELQLDFIAIEYRKKFFISDLSKVDADVFGVDYFDDKYQLDFAKFTKNPNAMLLQTRIEDKFSLADHLDGYFKEHIDINAWGGPNGILEVVPAGISKASALKYLMNVLEIPHENLLAFGDEHNDIEMLKFAGTGYAMKNAGDRLIPYADEILPWTNDEDGVARKLEELFLK